MLNFWKTYVEPVKEEQIKLLDVSLVVIGQGAVAREIVRRRRHVGGRVCWLWTKRLPQKLAGPLGADDHPKPVPSRSALVMSSPHVQSTSSELDDIDDLSMIAETSGAAEQSTDFESKADQFSSGYCRLAAQISWDLSSFVWKPPSWYCRRADDKDVRRAQKEMGSLSLFWRTSGPEIVELLEDESYTLVLGSPDDLPGVQVLDAKHSEPEVLWEISGTVVFAGDEFSELARVVTVCKTVEDAGKVEVGVSCEDAKPFVTVRASHAFAWATISFLQFMMYFLLLGSKEMALIPGEIPWWRASFAALTILPFGSVATPDVFGTCSTGRRGGTCESIFASVLCAIGQFAACLTPIGWVDGAWYTWPLYSAQCLAFAWYAFWTLPLHITSAIHARRHEETSSGIRWRAHIGWLAWIIFGSFGSWLLLYAVAYVYIYLHTINQLVSTIALPLLTSSVEIVIVIGTVHFYNQLILRNRPGRDGLTVFGDQRRVLIIPICMTHAYAESTRLVSLVAGNVKHPDWSWAPVLLASFVLNIFIRTTNSTQLLTYVVPSRYWWLVCPDAGTVLHNEVRLCFGYPRFVPLLALGLSNMILHGFEQWPLFNSHVTAIVLTALLLELVEDMIVTSGVLAANSWKYRTASVYRGKHALECGQVMGFDRDGIQPSGPAIAFSGIRFLEFRTVVVAMAPACFFAYNLLTLLLGAGFVHGVCDTWLPEEHRILDGLVWRSPLRCE